MDLHLYTTLLCVKFADDSSFKCEGKTSAEVEEKGNEELKKIARWFRNNRLTLHPDKSRYIIHSRDKLINLKLEGRDIMRCGYGLQEESVRLLGLNIDEDLSWKVHVDGVRKKINKGNYLLWRHGKKLNVETKKILYESFVRTHLNYCLSVWGGAKKSIIKPLDISLKKIWKKIGRYKQHTLNRLQKHKILKLEDELQIQECKIIWKWSKGKLPVSLNNIITEKNNALRGRQFEIYRNAKQTSINYRLSKRAGSLINNLTSATSSKSLTKKLTMNILNSYNFVCSDQNCFICH